MYQLLVEFSNKTVNVKRNLFISNSIIYARWLKNIYIQMWHIQHQKLVKYQIIMKKQPADLIIDMKPLKIFTFILSNAALCVYTVISRAEGE